MGRLDEGKQSGCVLIRANPRCIPEKIIDLEVLPTCSLSVEVG